MSVLIVWKYQEIQEEGTTLEGRFGLVTFGAGGNIGVGVGVIEDLDIGRSGGDIMIKFNT